MLVTCDYIGKTLKDLPGANIDGDKMRHTFKFLNYDIKERKNTTKADITEMIEGVSKKLDEYTGPTENKTVIFAFSGHGTNKGEREQIYDNEGVPLDLLQDVVRHLVKPIHSKAAKIPVLFFIDACRGDQHLVEDTHGDIKDVVTENETDLGPKGPPPTVEDVEHYFDKVVDEVYGNYRLDYCTIPAYVSYSTGDGSMWMPNLAEKMVEEYDSFQNVSATVRRMVFQHPVLKKEVKKQQCESVGSLFTGPLYLTKRA